MDARAPGLRSLPVELLYEIFSYLSPPDAVNLVLSDYEYLSRRSMGPILSRRQVDALVCAPDLQNKQHASRLERLPTEILLQILVMLPPIALSSLALAYYHMLRHRGIAGQFVQAYRGNGGGSS
ncbi:MAG: hypothetical protein M1815_000363 [Lichina confinis]|nr:MAG: hypothetical protein M1815_000363 [Lichina confinis]